MGPSIGPQPGGLCNLGPQRPRRPDFLAVRSVVSLEYIYVDIHTYIPQMYTSTYVRTYIHTYVHIYIYIYLFIYEYIHVQVYIHIHMVLGRSGRVMKAF